MNDEDFEGMARTFFQSYDTLGDIRLERRVERLAVVLKRAHRIGQRELRDKIISTVHSACPSGSQADQ